MTDGLNCLYMALWQITYSQVWNLIFHSVYILKACIKYYGNQLLLDAYAYFIIAIYTTACFSL